LRRTLRRTGRFLENAAQRVNAKQQQLIQQKQRLENMV
jgi:hypothetical protein